MPDISKNKTSSKKEAPKHKPDTKEETKAEVLMEEMKEVTEELKEITEEPKEVKKATTKKEEGTSGEAEKTETITEVIQEPEIKDEVKTENVEKEATNHELEPAIADKPQETNAEMDNVKALTKAETTPSAINAIPEEKKPETNPSQETSGKPEDKPAESQLNTQVQSDAKPAESQTVTAASETPSVQQPPTIEPVVKKQKTLPLLGIFKKKPKTETTPTATEQQAKRKLPKGLKIALIVFSILLLIAVATAGATYILAKPVYENGMKTYALAQETYAAIKLQDLAKTQEKIRETKASMQTTQESFTKLSFLKVIPVVSTYFEDAEAGMTAAVAGVEAGEIMVDAVLPYADVLGFTGEGTFSGGTAEDRIVKMVETLDKISPKLEEVSGKLVIVNTELEKIDPNDYPEEIKGKRIREKIVSSEKLVSEVTKALTEARPLVEALPQILGYPEGKSYIVIFQNDGELRATGGFMSAFAVLHLDKGRVQPKKSDDIYSLDNKFSKNIKPPEVISKYLNEKRWNLRNMNTSADFKQSMMTFKQYYDELPDEFEAQGIVAIDTEVLSRMVEITGPLDVPGYGTFTTDIDPRCNLPQIICELEHIIDKPLATMQSNRKASILGPMMQVLLQKSMGGGKEQLAKLIPLGFELLEQKHILVYFDDEKLQQAAESFNIAGRITEYEGDYLHVNNANFGGAKSNFYIDELVEQEIEVGDDGSVQKKVTLTYTHTEPGDNCNLEAGQLCLSGIQRNLFRIYVPKGSELVEGLGSETEITTGEELGKTYFEGFLKINPQSRAKVVLTYKLPYKIQANSDYKMLIQKQPGTHNNTYKVNLKGHEEEFVLTKDTEKSWKI